MVGSYGESNDFLVFFLCLMNDAFLRNRVYNNNNNNNNNDNNNNNNNNNNNWVGS